MVSVIAATNANVKVILALKKVRIKSNNIVNKVSFKVINIKFSFIILF